MVRKPNHLDGYKLYNLCDKRTEDLYISDYCYKVSLNIPHNYDEGITSPGVEKMGRCYEI